MAKRKKDNEDAAQDSSGDSEDNFGLPEIDYKPLDRTEVVPEPPVTESQPEPEPQVEQPRPSEELREENRDYSEEDNQSSSAPMIIILTIVLVLGISGFLVYKYWYVPRAKAKQEQLVKEAADKKKKDEDARLAKEKEEAERQRLAAEAAANAKPAVGTIETVSAPTHRFYVIVSSSIDNDLIMDFAKKLSAKGISSKILPSLGNSKFHRLSIGDFGSYGDAQSSADASKAEYGNSLWVIKY